MRIKDAIDKGELYDLDISPELAAAMNKLSYLRETGQTVDTYLQQMSLVEDLSPWLKRCYMSLISISAVQNGLLLSFKLMPIAWS